MLWNKVFSPISVAIFAFMTFSFPEKKCYLVVVKWTIIPRKFTERWEMLNEMYDKQALSHTYHNKTSLKQGAYIHQPTAWAVPHAYAQPYHPGSGSHGQLFHPYWGSSAWHSCHVYERANPCLKDPLLPMIKISHYFHYKIYKG